MNNYPVIHVNADYPEVRKYLYCLAKINNYPVIHVNADYPEVRKYLY
jgi:Zn-dependent peptidase ImmA (M78 family)